MATVSKHPAQIIRERDELLEIKNARIKDLECLLKASQDYGLNRRLEAEKFKESLNNLRGQFYGSSAFSPENDQGESLDFREMGSLVAKISDRVSRLTANLKASHGSWPK
jgi:hypothetical protein